LAGEALLYCGDAFAGAFMFVALLLIGPVGIAGLFAFAIFADRHFRDTVVFRQDRMLSLDDSDQTGSTPANQPRRLEIS
jgi:hypothetical protein